MVQLSSSAIRDDVQLLHVTRAESTNAAALAAVQAGADRLWVVADEQTAGRGRHGRDWVSPPGNLYASLGLSDPCPAEVSPLLGFVAGLSLVEAACMLVPASMRARLRLKWPNDCLQDGGKLSGILLEGMMLPARKQGVTIGIGVNIRHKPEGIGQETAHLCALNPDATPGLLFEALSARMSDLVSGF